MEEVNVKDTKSQLWPGEARSKVVNVCIRNNIAYTSFSSIAGDVLWVLLQDVTGSGCKWQLRMAGALCLGGTSCL